MEKHLQVRDNLAQAIRTGEFAAGRRLPSERDLAKRFGVSYMTARRAVSDLVEADLLERRAREGTYVRSHSHERLTTTTLNLICSASEASVIKHFLRAGAKAAEEQGWRPQVIRLNRDQERGALGAIQNREPSLVLAEEQDLRGALAQVMQQADGRAVLIGNRLDSLGIPSVLADDAQAIRLAVSHLRAHGRREIALVADDPGLSNARVQIAAWRSCLAGEFPPDVLDKRLVTVGTPRFGCRTQHAYEVMRRYLAAGPGAVTAFLCIDDETALGVLAACRDAGISVPTRMSLINSGDSSLMAFAHPPVTCIDVDMQRHVDLALQMLQAACENTLTTGDRLRLVEPHLVERQSVGTRQ